jgi:hypothetical protein
MPAGAQVAGSGAGSSVGYIDPAPVQSQVRLRFDAAYNNRRPNRAEFFYAAGRPFGPGLPLPERSVDYQDFTLYAEFAGSGSFSGFVELPVRGLNPEVNDNHPGYGDTILGGKYELLGCDDCSAATVQVKVYMPTGDASRGLGTDHFSIEPGLLILQRLDECTVVEGELRYWQPLGGTRFAGPVVRYGVGVSYAALCCHGFTVLPVAELVGWTVLEGNATAVAPSGFVTIEDAIGDTIVNGKLGVRTVISEYMDVYAGYGRPLTGDRWYESIWRVEYRLRF